MYFAGSSGRMLVSILAGMAGMGCESVGGGCSSVRLSNSTSGDSTHPKPRCLESMTSMVRNRFYFLGSLPISRF